MDIVIWLALGAVAGFLAVIVVYRTIPNTPIQIAGAILVGLLGGWAGGFLTDLIGLEAVNWIGSLVIAFTAALLVLLLIARVSPGK